MNGVNKVHKVTFHNHSLFLTCPPQPTAGRPFNPLINASIIGARKLFFNRLQNACRDFQNCRVYTDDLIGAWWTAITAFTLQAAVDGHTAAYIANSIEHVALSSNFFIPPTKTGIQLLTDGPIQTRVGSAHNA